MSPGRHAHRRGVNRHCYDNTLRKVAQPTRQQVASTAPHWRPSRRTIADRSAAHVRIAALKQQPSAPTSLRADASTELCRKLASSRLSPF
jgi:hypothetical protein